MFWVGMVFTAYNMCDFINYIVVSTKEEQASKAGESFSMISHQGMKQIASGVILVVMSVVQYKVGTIDPIDSDFIVYE